MGDTVSSVGDLLALQISEYVPLLEPVGPIFFGPGPGSTRRALATTPVIFNNYLYIIFHGGSFHFILRQYSIVNPFRRTFN